jgi:hypothetical protein
MCGFSSSVYHSCINVSQNKLRTHLPPLARLPHQWSLLYSLDQHGISISTFYSRVEAHDGNGVIIVIRDDDAEALEEKRSFGVWVGDGVRRVNGKGYYGSGESYVCSDPAFLDR